MGDIQCFPLGNGNGFVELLLEIDGPQIADITQRNGFEMIDAQTS